MMDIPLPISVAIPTYRREQVLLDTIGYLLSLEPSAAEILVLDQTEQHEPATLEQLQLFNDSGKIRWLRFDLPSIPKTMNRGLLEAAQDIVLFLDDDIRPEADLLTAHFAIHQIHNSVLVAGRVIQPWQEGVDFSKVRNLRFAALKIAWINEFIGCNFSVRRKNALCIGGFDENFVRVAYRFEAEFAHRFLKAGNRIYFEPRACIHHLKAVEGGTRTYDNFLVTAKPDHAVGSYYYYLRAGKIIDFILRPLKAVKTRHHLRHPWQIPLSLLAEFRGMLWALKLFRGGPRYVDTNTFDHGGVPFPRE